MPSWRRSSTANPFPDAAKAHPNHLLVHFYREAVDRRADRQRSPTIYDGPERLHADRARTVSSIIPTTSAIRNCRRRWPRRSSPSAATGAQLEHRAEARRAYRPIAWRLSAAQSASVGGRALPAGDRAAEPFQDVADRLHLRRHDDLRIAQRAAGGHRSGHAQQAVALGRAGQRRGDRFGREADAAGPARLAGAGVDDQRREPAAPVRARRAARPRSAASRARRRRRSARGPRRSRASPPSSPAARRRARRCRSCRSTARPPRGSCCRCPVSRTRPSTRPLTSPPPASAAMLLSVRSSASVTIGTLRPPRWSTVTLPVIAPRGSPIAQRRDGQQLAIDRQRAATRWSATTAAAR